MLPRLMLRTLLSLHLKCSMVRGGIPGRTSMTEIVKMARPQAKVWNISVASSTALPAIGDSVISYSSHLPPHCISSLHTTGVFQTLPPPPEIPLPRHHARVNTLAASPHALPRRLLSIPSPLHRNGSRASLIRKPWRTTIPTPVASSTASTSTIGCLPSSGSLPTKTTTSSSCSCCASSNASPMCERCSMLCPNRIWCSG
jgi:hypothetical protein